MKILLAVDGSPYSDAAVTELLRRPWPPWTEVRVLSVAHPAPYFPDPLLIIAATHFDSLKDERERAARDVAAVAEKIAKSAPELNVTTQVLDGSPKKLIVEEAERWGSDLILVGSHGYGPTGRFLLGSVAQAVVTHAPCSVEVVRFRAPQGV
ncbi:MAG: universal stress protein [Acidobacteriaceae bacterium]